MQRDIQEAKESFKRPRNSIQQEGHFKRREVAATAIKRQRVVQEARSSNHPDMKDPLEDDVKDPLEDDVKDPPWRMT
ncbi:hypothetical protein Pcinc_033758 [Petrolisthes cinctipes]|uniref:Uncharacterized protein n=1 Tax=Petrolisthes cinctipes TaxID=88211 RepID=A0AAE1ERI8_PETCI|nr:hypothetical protein Pcinc_033758 [Petrolisthes cinctipes]